MSTRGAIARKTAAGFTGVYHHWDSYPAGLGATLYELRNGLFAGDTDELDKPAPDWEHLDEPVTVDAIVGAFDAMSTDDFTAWRNANMPGGE